MNNNTNQYFCKRTILIIGFYLIDRFHRVFRKATFLFLKINFYLQLLDVGLNFKNKLNLSLWHLKQIYKTKDAIIRVTCLGIDSIVED